MSNIEKVASRAGVTLMKLADNVFAYDSLVPYNRNHVVTYAVDGAQVPFYDTLDDAGKKAFSAVNDAFNDIVDSADVSDEAVAAFMEHKTSLAVQTVAFPVRGIAINHDEVVAASESLPDGVGIYVLHNAPVSDRRWALGAGIRRPDALEWVAFYTDRIAA